MGIPVAAGHPSPMSDPTEENGSGNRATIALVNSKIDTVVAKLEGNAQVTEAHFETIKTRLDTLGDLPTRIDGVETRLNSRIDTEAHKTTALQALMSEMQGRREYRSKTLPPILTGVAALIVAVLAFIFGVK